MAWYRRGMKVYRCPRIVQRARILWARMDTRCPSILPAILLGAFLGIGSAVVLETHGAYLFAASTWASTPEALAVEIFPEVEDAVGCNSAEMTDLLNRL